MATSVSLGYCAWFAGATWSDQIGRLDVASETILGSTRGGVLMSASTPLAVTVTTGLNISIAPGGCVIPSTSGPSNGAYRMFNPTAQVLTVTAAPSSPNSRIDLVCATIVDNGNNTSFAELQIVTGTAGNPPTAPSTPTNSILLAQVLVGSNVVTLTQGNITDERIYAAAAGGSTYFPNTSSLPTGGQGLIGYDAANNRFFHWSVSGYQPWRVWPWAPAHVVGNGNATVTGNTGSGGTQTTLVFGTQTMSANITTDGQTDIQITAHWPGVQMATPTPTLLAFQIWIDSTVLDEIDVEVGTVSGVTYRYGGGTTSYTTSAGVGDTPSAASHTVTWKALANQQATAQTVTVVSAATRNSYLRVQPVSQ